MAVIGLAVSLVSPVPRAVASPPATTNLTSDGGFESGALASYENSYGSGMSTAAFQGAYAARVGNDGAAGAVSQVHTGLVPGGDYVAWVTGRTTDAASALKLTASQPGGNDVSAQSASTSWAPLTVDFTVAAGNDRAAVYCYKDATPGYGLCDEMNVHRVNKIAVADAGFESGSLGAWTHSYGSSVTDATAHTGTRSAKVGSSGVAGAVSQRINGLKPNTSYVATAWAMTRDSSVALVASQYGGPDVSHSLQSSQFAPARVMFTTGPTGTGVNLYCAKGATGEAWCDDFALRELRPNVDDPVTGTLQIPAGYLTVGLDSAGTVVDLVDSRSGADRIAPGKRTSLVSLVVNGQTYQSTSVTRSPGDADLYTFANAQAGYQVDVRTATKAGYTTLEVTRVTAPAGADVQTLLWGPLPVAIGQTVGESVGIVRDNGFAIGLKPLTDRTEGAWPREYKQTGWQSDVIANPYYLQDDEQEEWSAAAKTTWGSQLRAFTFDYTKERLRKNRLGHAIPVGPLTAEPTVVGSKIALFGMAPELAPTVLSSVALGEKLPYPRQNGQWQKASQASSQSLLVLEDLHADNIEVASGFAKAAGINSVYALTPKGLGPWRTDGSYQFAPDFGGDDDGATALVANAEAKGAHVGVHTLSDFIAPGDPYITTADPRLALAGRAKLSRPLSATDTSLFLDGGAPVAAGIIGNTLRVGNEFIRYTGATQVGSEWQVTGLSRGQWGSTAAGATSNTTVSRLIQNSYGGAIGGLGIIDEIATRFATIANTTGVRAHSFDGLESASQSGWGSFGMARLVNSTYAQTDRKDGYVTETSRTTSNTWDAVTRASWGEISITSMDQLFKNDVFYEANYLPSMMGWLGLNGGDSLLNVEAKLARAAGLDAGVDFVGRVANLQAGSRTGVLLDAIKQWDTARNLGAFTEAQKAALRDTSTYWRLTVVQPGKSWSLQQLNASGNPVGSAQSVSAPTPQLDSAALPAAGLDKLYEARVISNTPATVRFAVTAGSLPAGLQLNNDTGGIIGTPTAAGQSTFTITATNSGGLQNAQRTYSITVN
ncbi:putative Ig domain-containing protein [Streptomyces sp. NPDC051582]|uniref:putative Ig domain-containing protein n=1 Tax=Streptomyces sp. NPDC051582 TaxID=3155167 RepID=UPI003418F86C